MRTSEQVYGIQVGETLLGAGDDIIVELNEGHGGQLNDLYLTYRNAGEVKDPDSGDTWGVMTELTGLVILGPQDGKGHRAKVVKSVLEIEPGQFLTPMVQNPFKLFKKNARQPRFKDDSLQPNPVETVMQKLAVLSLLTRALMQGLREV